MNSLEKLEFNKILEILKSYCITYIGKQLVEDLLPNNSFDKVQELLSETDEAINLSYRNSFPSFYEIANITIDLRKLESSSILSLKSILQLTQIFKLGLELKNYFSKDFLDAKDFPILAPLFSMLYSNKSILDKVNECVIDENTLDDKASKNLQSIRKKSRKLEQDIRAKLNDMIHSYHYHKYIQENVITIRNDRFVIPIKSEYRSEIKGFVHDISNAGSTVFIEPISVFEMNNELSKLKLEEEIEIEKILQELSVLFVPYINELAQNVEVIGRLDFIFAKAKYAKNIKANISNISKDKNLILNNARHPLIDPNSVVPISLTLGKDFSVLLITGPNTGGKTVTLKTVGLLTCMTCSGLAIPADRNSQIPVFDNIFADIGDDQSILASLSTFSSHMLNITEIVKQSTENSLILVDELGSGTDPLEGSHLAISILDYLKNKGCLTIATTHYQELKQYGLVTDGFENASVEFDIKTLSPTYRLLVGIPGKSNAFEISKKLGLDENIIENAKSLMSEEQISIEELLKSIYDDKSIIEKEKSEILKKSTQIDELKNSLLQENQSLKLQEQELISNAKIKARNILLDAKEEANEIIKNLNDISNSTSEKNLGKDLNKLRTNLNNKIKDLSSGIISTSDTDTVQNYNNKNTLKTSEIKKGLEVYIPSLSQNGTILSNISKSKEVQVQIGSLKMNLPISKLEKTQNTSNSKNKTNANTKNSTNYSSISKTRNAKTEINVIGLNVEEAIFVVDKFLDDAYLAKLETVRIVHGKGTGKLRKGIQQFLKSHPQVKSYRIGTFGEGEMGVTIVEL